MDARRLNKRRVDSNRRVGDRRVSLDAKEAPEVDRRRGERRSMARRAEDRGGVPNRRRLIRDFVLSAGGQGMVEYALILVLISIVVIVILITMGAQIANVFSNVVAGLSN
jgi:pilus assembly protein Flp/PilA